MGLVARCRWLRWIAIISVTLSLLIGPNSLVPGVARVGADISTIDPTLPVAGTQGGITLQTPTIRTVQLADGSTVVADRVIVGFKSGTSDVEKAAVHAAVGGRHLSATAPKALKVVNENAQYVDVTGAPSLDAVTHAYQADPHVAYAEGDHIARTFGVPNDPYFVSQYALTKINAPAAWDVTRGLATVKIAILDCGITESHPDLAGKVVGRQDFTGSAYGTDDRCNHGTAVASIAAANTNNAVGMAGIAYATSLMNGKVMVEQYDAAGNLTGGAGSSTWVAAGIHWAADNGAKVINLSMGSTGACAQTYQDAINYAWSKNVVIVVAAGNDSANEAFQPADCAHVVAVGSTDESDARLSFSNYGTWVHVAAPGSHILCALNPALAANQGQSYGTGDGTSFAAPVVAGLVGLLWATHFGTGAQAVVTRLESTADRIAGTGTSWQYGRINAGVAVGTPVPVAASLSPASVPPLSPAFTLTVNGTNFQPGATVQWSGSARITIVVNSTQVTAAILATDVVSVGTESITVANPDGGMSSPALPFIIGNPPPQPSAIAPSTGSPAGGTAIRISGTGFRAGATVTFDGLAARVTAITATTIDAITPAHAVGTVNVVVKDSDNQLGTLTGAFAYVIAPDPSPRPGSITTGIPAPIPVPRSSGLPTDAGAGTGADTNMPIHR